MLFILQFMAVLSALGSEVHSTRISRSSNIETKTTTFGSDRHGRCECALFQVKSDQTTDLCKPVMSKESIEIACNKEGEITCEKLCVEVSKAAQNQGPIIVCEAARNMEHLILRLYTRVCQSPEWKYTGVQSQEELCCKDGVPKPCTGASRIPQSLTGPIIENPTSVPAGAPGAVQDDKTTTATMPSSTPPEVFQV